MKDGSRLVPLADWFERLGGLTPIDGNLHRCPIPMTRDHFRLLRSSGIEVVFSMEEAVPGHLAQASGLEWRPHFWTDDQPPTREQLDRFLADYLAVSDATPVVVHCKAGWGRAGTAITSALVAKRGWSAQQALDHYWARVPPARAVMESNGQAEFVRGFAASRVGRGLDAR